MALVTIGLRRWRRNEATRVKAVLAATASYAALFVLLLWEALQGRSITSTDAATLASLGVWAAGTLLALGWVAIRSRDDSRNLLKRVAA